MTRVIEQKPSALWRIGDYGEACSAVTRGAASRTRTLRAASRIARWSAAAACPAPRSRAVTSARAQAATALATASMSDQSIRTGGSSADGRDGALASVVLADVAASQAAVELR